MPSRIAHNEEYDGDGWDDQSYKHKHARRYEDKYAKFMSHTARRRHYYRASLDKSASVSVEPGSGAFVYQSKGLLLTAVELTGLLPVMTMYGQGKVSLSKRGLWRDLVPFLQAHAVSSSVCPARSSRSSYCSAATERTSYSVAAEGFVCIDNREDAERLLLEATVADTLYCAPRRDEQSPDVMLRVFADLRASADPGLDARRIKKIDLQRFPRGKRHADRKGGDRHHHETVHSAHVGARSHSSCWLGDPADPNACVEIDLHREHWVMEIGTAGRFPVTAVYPSWAQRHEWQAQGDRYTGPTYQVVDTAADQSWVTRYELLARRQGGREWFSVGVFNANTDCTSESRATLCEHSERASEAVCARYLRLRPIAFHNAKAMRIAVYGTPCADIKPTDRHVAASLRGDDEDYSPTITYSLHLRRGRCCDQKYYTKQKRSYSPDYGDASLKGSKMRLHRAKELVWMLPDELGCVDSDRHGALAEPEPESEPEPEPGPGPIMVPSGCSENLPVSTSCSSETAEASAFVELTGRLSSLGACWTLVAPATTLPTLSGDWCDLGPGHSGEKSV